MKNTFRQFLCTLFLFLTFVSFASDSQVLDFTDRIISSFNKIWISFPQEKAYLQTDKPYYSAGENLWIKGYLVNATTHQPKTFSRYLYVELIDKSDSVISRVKIRKDSLGFSGSIKLKPELSPGYYTLRAFTYWMQNLSGDFFFSKNIYIGNSILEGVSCQINYGTPANGNIPVKLSFSNSSQSPVSGKTVLVSENGSRSFRKKRSFTTNPEGKIMFQLSVDSADHAKKSIEVTMNDGKPIYHDKFYLPEFSTDFDVQFFSESGVLLNDNMQIIAFKAIGADGLSVEVKGKIYTSKDEEVTEFSSLHKGMGKFLFVPKLGESCYAIVRSAGGVEKRFNLPHAQAEGVALHLAIYGGRIVYEVINHSNRSNNSLYLLIHSRGKVYAIQPVNSLGGQISESALPAGLNSFAIIDSAGNTLCERLIFGGALNLPGIKMESDKASYGKREPVDLNLNIRTASGKPCAGNFSVSITDSRMVKKDTLADNILSYLLLSSDIKGYIEDPAAYFSGNSVFSGEKMDVLMLTQGWRRFSTADVVKGQFAKPTYYLEAGQALSGKVINLVNKPSKNCDIIVLSGYNNMMRTTQTDSLGRYLIDGIEFPDSTSFILKAKKKKSLTDVEIIPDSDLFLKATNNIPIPRTEQIPAPEAYFQQSREKYYYEGGMRAINIDEVTVTADKIDSKPHRQYYDGMSDSQITSRELERFPGMYIIQSLSLIPGVQVVGEKILIRGSSDPLILIDGFETEDVQALSYLTASDVDEIAVFKGASAAIFGSRGGNGVIAITLKSGIDRFSKIPTPPSLVHVIPLGFMKPTQFYVPKYEVDSVRQSSIPDLRTTIYWNPELRSDSTGNVHVKFYTADKANNYSVVLEGITNEGEICRYVGALKREGN